MPSEAAGSAAEAAREALHLRARVLSSAVLAPGALAAAWAGGPVFAGVVAAGGVILAREWSRMADAKGDDPAFAMTAGGAAGAAIAAAASQMLIAWAWAFAAAFAAAGERLRRSNDRADLFSSWFGVLYVAGPCAALVWLRLAPDGAERVTYLFGCIWAADIGAFFAGWLIGGPRLLPKVSPTKTWAGLIAGVLMAGAAGGALAWVFEWDQLGFKVLGAMALGAAGLGGDLLESYWKRRFGVKDAGALIPGHGGLLDRVDGLMLASLVYAAKVFLWP